MFVRRSAMGFTIVELIIVISLLGILSVIAMARMVKPSAFAPSMVVNGLREGYAKAHQLAASRRDAVVTATLMANPSDWELVIQTDVDGVVSRSVLEQYNTSINAINGALSASLTSGSTVVATFLASGAVNSLVLDGAAGDATLGLQLDIAGDSVRNLCIYPTGYVTDAPCS